MTNPVKTRKEKMIIAAGLRAEGYSISATARAIGISRQTLHDWIKSKKLDRLIKPEDVKTPFEASVSVVQATVINETNKALREFQKFDGDVIDLLRQLKNLIKHVTNKAVEAMALEREGKPLTTKAASLGLRDIKTIIECIEKMREIFATIADNWEIKKKSPLRVSHELDGFDLTGMPDKELTELKLARDKLESICERHTPALNSGLAEQPPQQ